MGKVDKKISKLKERIASLEADMVLNLKQKTSSTAEISISDYHRKIEQARRELANLEKN